MSKLNVDIKIDLDAIKKSLTDAITSDFQAMPTIIRDDKMQSTINSVVSKIVRFQLPGICEKHTQIKVDVEEEGVFSGSS